MMLKADLSANGRIDSQGIHTNSLASASAGARECRLGCIGVIVANRGDDFLDVGSLVAADCSKIRRIFLSAALKWLSLWEMDKGV